MADARTHHHARAGRGGIKAIFLAQASGIVAVKTDPHGRVERVQIRPEAALAANLTTVEDEALYTERSVLKNGARSVTHTLEITLEGIFDLPDTGWVAVAEMNDHQTRIIGYSTTMGLERPLRIEKAVADHGKSPASQPRTTIVMTSVDTSPAMDFTGEVEIV